MLDTAKRVNLSWHESVVGWRVPALIDPTRSPYGYNVKLSGA